MKACVIQPLYSADYADSERCFSTLRNLLARCDDSMDIIVCPEACDVPAYASGSEQFLASLARYHDELMQLAAETARRCRAMLFVCGYDPADGGCGWRNTTFAFDREGNVVGKYFKQHLTPGESDPNKRNLDSDYSFAYSPVTVVEMEGLRFGFLTCYDFYFYEAFPNLAREKLDIIIGCSHQRTDSHAALEMMTRFCAYNTNTYILRASVSMGEDSPVGGASMIVKPDGTILADLESRVDLAAAEFDPAEKYYKPAGFGGDLMAHHEYIERGRRPWKYRPAGPAISRSNDSIPYPRVCAHRGFNTVAPENSLPAFGAAVALGADEIEFDLWYTTDGEIVSTHDRKLERVSTGEGYVNEKTYAELLELDFGVKKNEAYAGLRILRFEDILRKLACHTVMNIHLKTPNNETPWDEAMLHKLIGLIDQYDCRRYVYFMTGNDVLMAQLCEIAPDICRCCGGGSQKWEIVERGIKFGCQKVQLFKPYFNQEMIDRAHAAGMLCNVFWSDDPEETERFLDMGIDTILTNDYFRISQVVRAHSRNKR